MIITFIFGNWYIHICCLVHFCLQTPILHSLDLPIFCVFESQHPLCQTNSDRYIMEKFKYNMQDMWQTMQHVKCKIKYCIINIQELIKITISYILIKKYRMKLSVCIYLPMIILFCVRDLKSISSYSTWTRISSSDTPLKTEVELRKMFPSVLASGNVQCE